MVCSKKMLVPVACRPHQSELSVEPFLISSNDCLNSCLTTGSAPQTHHYCASITHFANVEDALRTPAEGAPGFLARFQLPELRQVFLKFPIKIERAGHIELSAQIIPANERDAVKRPHRAILPAPLRDHSDTYCLQRWNYFNRDGRNHAAAGMNS